MTGSAVMVEKPITSVPFLGHFYRMFFHKVAEYLCRNGGSQFVLKEHICDCKVLCILKELIVVHFARN